ncbi:bestrophin family protein [Lysobacter solisilvae (ex Woo and Kim 2020)]|uniref:Bestrophin n=1 Tax=Agrilutibacter terrestris TaxID=2865112 RepID=A0A7H0FXE0_9GAMM|nr:bestrophin family protein [Lysobacter terrestris]QNP40706.1 bestrophin [Lysobacter terrestris]
MIVRPRNATSIFTLLFALKGSIIPVIWPRVLYTMLLSLAVVATDLRGLVIHFSIDPAMLTLLGLTLAIFLGFRNSVAYQRWWEGRTLWGDLIIASRNLARQTQAFMPSLDPDPRKQLVHDVIGFSHALRHHLRDSAPDSDLQRWLAPGVYAAAMASPNRPNAVLGAIGETYAQAARATGLDGMLSAAIDRELCQLSHVMGACERIKTTPIPFAYILLLHRTVLVYCFMLPFCLIDPLGWLTPIAVGILAYTFFGLDAIGEQIEGPFDTLPNDLPLDALCRTIEINLLSLLGETDLPQPLEPVEYVLS